MFPIYCHSKNHKRYQKGTFIEESRVDRFITLDFSMDAESVVVSINPTLSPKKAHLYDEDAHTLYYRGEEPDYEFIIHKNYNNQVDTMTLKRLDTNVTIVYTCLVD